MSSNFYSNTLSGVELIVKFAFSKMIFTKKYTDKNNYIYYNIGVMSDISWNEETSASAKYALTSIKPIDLPAGISIASGDMAFKTFHHESLALIKKEILKGIDNGTNKIDFALIEENPFITIVEDSSVKYGFGEQLDGEKINWSQMPLFDIILISSADDDDGIKSVSTKTIKGVKITSEGFAESIESLEVNAMASFLSIGGVTDWEVTNV
jgi:hypothetical protein